MSHRGALLGVAVSLACCAPADAATRYATPAGVNTGDCTTLGSACEITRAFGQAAAGDTVSIGIGTYTVNNGISFAKRLIVTATTPRRNRPTLQSNNISPLLVDVGSNGTTVRHIAFTDTKAGGTAVQVRDNATFTDVAVTSAAGCISPTAPNKTLALDRITATSTGGAGVSCLTGEGTFNVTDSTITANAAAAAYIQHGTITDSTLTGRIGLQLRNTDASGRRLLVDSPAADFGSGVQLTAGALLTDSLVTVATGIAVVVYSDATIDNVTAIGTGSGSTAIHAFAEGAPIASHAVLIAHNVIARAKGTDLVVDSCSPAPCTPAEVHIDHSNFVTKAGAGTFDDKGGNIATDPQFAGAADYHLLRTSPSIDTGATSAQAGPQDRDGNARIVGAAVDMGAFEYQGDVPQVTTGEVTDITTTGAVLHGTVDAGNLATTATFAFGDTTSYGLAAAGSALAAKFGGQPVTGTLTGLAPGHTYHVRLSATNAKGTGDGADVTFTTAAGPGGGGGGGGAAPAVTNFRATPARFRVGRRSTAVIARTRKPPPRGTKLRFRLSARAGVTIVFARRANKRFVPIRAKLTRSSLAAGGRAIAFSGRLGKTKLRPGRWRATLVAFTPGTTTLSKRVSTTFRIVKG